MKRVVVNAISIREGGGAVVLDKLMRSLCQQQSHIHWLVFVDSSHEVHWESKNITVFRCSWAKKSPLHLGFWYEVYLPIFTRNVGASLVFSQTNFLPFRKLSCPSYLLVHHAGYFSPQYAALYLKSETRWVRRLEWYFRCYWVSTSIRRANSVCVQTKALKDAISLKLNVPDALMEVIPHGPGLADGSRKQPEYPIKRAWRIGYITKYGIQKNFDVLFHAIYKLKKQGIACRLVLTLNVAHPSYQQVAQLINQYELHDCVENHGEIKAAQIQALYKTLDLFIFPSLCESFGFTLIEAMYYGLPIIAADTLSNQELLGEHGIFFIPEQPDSLLDKILSIMTSQSEFERFTEYSFQQGQAYDWTLTSRKLGKQVKALVNMEKS